MFNKIKKPAKPKIPKAPKVPKIPKVKIEKNEGFLKWIAANKLKIVVLTILLAFLIFINVIIQEFVVGILSIVLYLSIVIFIIVKAKMDNENKLKNETRRNTPIKEIVLIDEDGVETTKWDIAGVPSLIIGKHGEKEFVDIDLTETTYSNLISREHAIMNHDGTTWFVEDIGSMNGTGVKSSLNGSVTKLLEGTRFPVYAGDIIYIANTTLLLK